jgi:hypothetical protein
MEVSAMAARSVHEVRDAVNAQVPPEFPVENWCDCLTGQRLRRVYLGGCSGGYLIIGNIARNSGIDLYFRRMMGNPTKPKSAELDLDLRRYIERCWTQQLRKTGVPVLQRQNNLWWLARMPCGSYHVESGVAGGSLLFRFHPIIARPRAAVAVAVAVSRPRHSPSSSR